MSRRQEVLPLAQDSEDEDLVLPVPKRQKTHRFKTFAQRVADVSYHLANVFYTRGLSTFSVFAGQ